MLRKLFGHLFMVLSSGLYAAALLFIPLSGVGLMEKIAPDDRWYQSWEPVLIFLALGVGSLVLGRSTELLVKHFAPEVHWAWDKLPYDPPYKRRRVARIN